MGIGRGVDLDIIEIKREGEPLTGDGGHSIIVPNRVLVNGLPVLVPDSGEIRIDASASDAVVATVPMFVNRLSIHAEHPEIDDTDPPMYAALMDELDCDPRLLGNWIHAYSVLRAAW